MTLVESDGIGTRLTGFKVVGKTALPRFPSFFQSPALPFRQHPANVPVRLAGCSVFNHQLLRSTVWTRERCGSPQPCRDHQALSQTEGEHGTFSHNFRVCRKRQRLRSNALIERPARNHRCLMNMPASGPSGNVSGFEHRVQAFRVLAHLN